MLQAIIFDMDGVLVDSTDIIYLSLNKILSKYNVRIPRGSRPKYLGRSLRDLLALWKQDFPTIPSDLRLEDVAEEALTYQQELMTTELAPNDVILSLIRHSKNDGIKIAVATSSMKKRAKMMLTSLGIFNMLDALVASEDVENHKPHPDIFLKTAQQLQVAPKNCVVIEDSVNGIQAANAASMKSVAKLTAYHTKEDFFEADYVFSGFRELKLKDLKNLWKK